MYQLTTTTTILRISDGACIPADAANTDWQQYQQWLSAGNAPEPATPPPAQDIAALRRAAYAAEADPIFFMAQRGEATQAEWLAKIAEIRARYPMSEPA